MDKRSQLATIVLPVGAAVMAMASIQVGAATAQGLFPLVGAEGTTALRVSLAAALLLAIRRPSLKNLRKAQLRAIAIYGAALGAMNLLFYLSLQTIPLGIAVALEFSGPLVIAVFSHRNRLDVAWLTLAAAGLAALAPFGDAKAALSPLGVAFALGAGFFWALYILFGRKAGAAGSGPATSWGMAAAACVVVPFGVAHAGAALFAPAILPLAGVVAVLSSVAPYSLEMFALTRLPRVTFGTLMSLEPALGALCGWLILHQHLTLRQDSAIVCIVLGSAGAAATAAWPRSADAGLSSGT